MSFIRVMKDESGKFGQRNVLHQELEGQNLENKKRKGQSFGFLFRNV